jgi:hypothetical protein
MAGNMKSARTANSSKKPPVALKPLPVPRLKPLSAEKILNFQRRFSPEAMGRGVDGVATVIKLRRGA